ncbi:MAG: helix-hairpin-helix domain-containing protein [Chitinophagaceae bacterium]|nr:MAG: helix-hairpin-helix domain-containing protein [Chitinophagaceae bacterium]
MKQLIILFLCLCCYSGFSQDLPSTTQQQLENLGDESLEDDALLQQLEFYRKHPINLNTASTEDLQPLRFLSALQIDNFIRYRSLFGKLIDIYELQAVPGFDVITIQKIRPYIVIGSSITVKEDFLSRLKGGEQYALLRFARVLEKAKGYNKALPTHYLGDANRLMFRYRYQYKTNLYYGIVADKDAGEQFFRGSQKLGFDFYSVHFFARNLGNVKALALGDFTVNLGQGLTQWQSLGFGKSADVINIKRQSPVLMPYRSSGEFYFNRGAGITVNLNHLEATGFFSYKKLSANIDVDSVNHFTSFGTSGYYRTKNEVADRYHLSDLSFGGNLRLNADAFKVGVNAVVHQFSLPMQKRDEPYNYFAFHGKQAFNASIDYNYTYKNAHLFGEIAVDKNSNKAGVQGILVSVDKRADLSFLYRSISKAYQSLFGNAFTENTLPGNESGIYVGVSLRPVAGWQLAAYADYYQFGFIKYRVSAPSKGWDYLAQITYTPGKQSEIYLRYRTENKPINESSSNQAINFPVNKVKQNLRLHFSTQVNSLWSIKGRTEMLWFDKRGIDKQEGFLSYIEVGGQPGQKIKGNVRLQYFETGGFESRVYVYESDVLYSFSIPAFYDKGFRYYINASYTPSPKFTFWLRLAQSIYPNKSSIGTGLEEITCNRKSEFKIQIKYEF